MKRVKINFLFGFLLVAIGTFLINPEMTANVIGNSGKTSNAQFFSSLMFLVAGTGMIFLTSIERMREMRRLDQEVGQRYAGGIAPTLEQRVEEKKYNGFLILDTNYISESCENNSKYKGLKNLINSSWEKGHPIYVSKDVLDEIKPLKSDNPEKLSAIKKEISSKTISLKDMEKDVDRKYEEKAIELLKQTPKYMAFKHMSNLSKGSSMDMNKILREKNARNPYSNEYIKNTLKKAENEFLYSEKKGGTRKLLHRYDLGEGDIAILKDALFLIDHPKTLGEERKDEVTIASSDEHIIQAVKIFNSSSAKKGKIKIKKD